MMRQKLTKILVMILVLLGITQQGRASGIPLEELGIYKYPDSGNPDSKKYVFQHVDHYPTEEEMKLAEGLYASAKTQLRRYHVRGLADKPDIRRGIVVTYSRAAYYGHPDATEFLISSLRVDWSGEKKYEREAARAVRKSPAKNLWDRAKDYQKMGKLPLEHLVAVIPKMDGVIIPKEIIEARRKAKAEEEREEAAEAVARLSAVTLEEADEGAKEGEPLLRRRPTAGLHEDDDHTG